MQNKNLQKNKVQFVDATLSWYKQYGRDLPWRHTTDPYKILVSELMLQQTQVPRVIPKYNAFLEKFPTINALAKAPLGDVLTMWSGLGYNRRAKFLHLTAKVVSEKHNGKLPTTPEELIELPGIGPYAAASICAFAYNKPTAVVDANIKKIYNRVFGATAEEINDFVAQTVPQNQACDFYNALMDISSQYYTDKENVDMTAYPYKEFCMWYNKKPIPQLKVVKQAKFKESNRWYRGQILKQLTANKQMTRRELVANEPTAKYEAALNQLIKEEFIVEKNNKISLKK